MSDDDEEALDAAIKKLHFQGTPSIFRRLGQPPERELYLEADRVRDNAWTPPPVRPDLLDVPRGPKRAKAEHHLQVLFVQWIDLMCATIPELELGHAIPNERQDRFGRFLRAKEGAKAGVPDWCLPVPRGPHPGLYLEFKRPGGTASQSQICFGLAAHVAGWHVERPFTLRQAQDYVTHYLEGYEPSYDVAQLHDFCRQLRQARNDQRMKSAWKSERRRRRGR